MKKLVTILILIASATLVHSQARVFTFTVNSKDYHIDEIQLNDFFGSSFQDMISKNNTKQSDFELWRDTFEDWKNLATQGRFSITTYGNVLGGSNYQGNASKEDMGLNNNGKTATGNPNKKSNKAVRMATLNYYLEHYIINNATEFRVNW